MNLLVESDRVVVNIITEACFRIGQLHNNENQAINHICRIRKLSMLRIIQT